MFAEISLLILIGVIWIFSGYQILRFLAPNTNNFFLVAMGAIMGEGIYLFLLNIGSYFFQTTHSALISLVLLSMSSVVFYSFNKERQLLNDNLRPPYASLFIIAILFLAILYTSIFFFGEKITFDPDFHYPMAATIAEGNFPPRLPLNPDYSVQYHYGPDLISASLVTVTGVQPWNAFNVLKLYNLLGAFALAVFLGRALGNNNFFSGFFAAILLFFGGSFEYLRTNAEILVSRMAPSYGLQLLHMPTALAVPFLLLTLCLILTYASREQTVKQNGLILMIIVSLSALALSSEDMFVLLVISVLGAGFFKVCMKFFDKKQQLAIGVLLAVITACIVAVLQGGTITESLFSGEHDVQVDQTVLHFQIRSELGLIFWHTAEKGFFPLSDPSWIIFLFEQMGPLPFIFPFIAYFVWKNVKRENQTLVVYMIMMAAVSLLIPTFIEYPANDTNFIRVYLTFEYIGSILFGIALGILFIKKFKYQKFITALSGIMFIAYIFAPVTYNIFQLQHLRYGWGWRSLPDFIQPQDLIIGNDIKKLTEEKSRILTNNYTTLMTTTGRFVPYASGRYNIYQYDPIFVRLFPRPSPSDLRLLEITYVYLAPYQQNNHHGAPQQFLDQGIDTQYIQNHPEWFTLVKQWAFNHQTYYLYRVIQ